MSEIHHTSRAHARLNASSSHRWMMCPPSVKLSEQFEDKPSTYAEEGSFLHELCELKLHRYLGDMAVEVVEAQYAEHRDSEFYSDEAESVTDEYVNFCVETIEAVRSSCPDPLIMVEHRLNYSEYVPEGFGTGDLVIVADGVIEVIDFKGGRGVRVDAHRNSQLMLYALGALLEFDPLYDIHHVRMTIVQPRLNNLSSYEMEADELLRWAETEVHPKAMLAYEGKGEFCAGEWCRFCKAHYTCRKRSEYHMRLAEQDFKQPDLLSDEEIADILPVAESLNSWVQDLMAYATQEAVDGKHWPGYKLVAGRTVRKYTSEAEVMRLPSGRNLCYQSPHFTENRFGNDAIGYYAPNAAGQMVEQETFGGKLAENATQAIARDILAHALLTLEKSGYPVVFHVHDEAVIEMPIGQGSLEEACRLMAIAPDWAENLPLRADGYECAYYQKS